MFNTVVVGIKKSEVTKISKFVRNDVKKIKKNIIKTLLTVLKENIQFYFTTISLLLFDKCFEVCK